MHRAFKLTVLVDVCVPVFGTNFICPFVCLIFHSHLIFKMSFHIFSSFHELMQSRGVRRPSVRLSVNFAQIATSTTEVAGSLPNLHMMVPRRARIQDVLKVKVKGHVIQTLFCLHENRFFYHKHDSIATKLAHDGPQTGLHPGCAQGQGQRSRDTGTSVMSRNVCYTVRSHVLSLHALTL